MRFKDWLNLTCNISIDFKSQRKSLFYYDLTHIGGL